MITKHDNKYSRVEWGDWMDWTVEYLAKHGIEDGYGLGYHQGCPTIYWRNTFGCIWRVPSDTQYIDQAIQDMKKDLYH